MCVFHFLLPIYIQSKGIRILEKCFWNFRISKDRLQHNIIKSIFSKQHRAGTDKHLHEENSGTFFRRSVKLQANNKITQPTCVTEWFFQGFSFTTDLWTDCEKLRQVLSELTYFWTLFLFQKVRLQNYWNTKRLGPRRKESICLYITVSSIKAASSKVAWKPKHSMQKEKISSLIATSFIKKNRKLNDTGSVKSDLKNGWSTIH